MRKTAPEPSALANHSSILPANCRRIVSRASEGIIGDLASGVALAVQLPIASTLVVTAAAAFISAEMDVDDLSSDMAINPFTGGKAVGVAVDSIAERSTGWVADCRARASPASAKIRDPA